MDFTGTQYHFRAGNDVLHVPFVINMNNASSAAVNDLLDSLEGSLGAKFFRDRDIFLEVLSDHIKRAADPYKWKYGPYIGVAINHKGEARLNSWEEVQGGMTVYSMDQYLKLAANLDGPLLPENAEPRKRPLRP